MAEKKIKWSTEQEKVISLRDRNILVSAAAGSGKTAVLVERIISLISDIENPVDIDRILVVTFTNAAASEMRERIRKKLKTAVEEAKSDQVLYEHLKRQEIIINNAQISTIDSFCNNLLKNHFHEVDIDPGFRLLQEGEKNLLMQQTVDQVFESCYEEGDSEFLDFVRSYGSKNKDKTCTEMVIELYDKAMSAPWPKEWLDKMVSAYDCTSADEVYNLMPVKVMHSNILNQLNYYFENIDHYIKLMTPDTENAERLVIAVEDKAYLAELGDSQDMGDLISRLGEVEFTKLPSKSIRSGEAKEHKEAFQSFRKEYQDYIKSLKLKYSSVDEKCIMSELALVRPMAHQLVRLTKLFMDRLDTSKKKKNAYDFSDIEHMALNILVDSGTHMPTKTALELKDFYYSVMIDEYQDSNLIQEALLAAISRDNNRFMVGDVKQSIYGFRQAEPSIFGDKLSSYTDFRKFGGDEQKNTRIDLNCNYRSRLEVLDTTNKVFDSIMHRDFGEVEYDQAARLKKGRAEEASYPYAAELLISEAEDKEDENAEDAEALTIALKIRDLINDKNFLIPDKDSGELRRARYSDFVILNRSANQYGDQYSKVLNKYDVPAVSMENVSYYDTLEVRNILNLLSIIDNPLQDIPLASVLRNIFGFSDEKLAIIRLHGQNKNFENFSENFFAYADESGDEEAVRFAGFLDRYRKARYDTPLHEMIRNIYKETGYTDRVTAMPGGGQRRQNLEQLIDRAIAFEATDYSGLFSFLNYINKLQKYKIEYGVIGNTGDEDNTVKIMSIHKSKGLEFPVVFVTGLAKSFNLSDRNGNFVVHNNAGIGLKTIDLKNRTRHDNIINEAVKETIEDKSLGEELRILYVAMTRAREKLILTGKLKAEDYDKLRMTTYSGDPEKYVLAFKLRKKAKNMLSWILPVMAVKDPEHIAFIGNDELEKEWIIDNAVNARSLSDLTPDESSLAVLDLIKKRLDFKYPYRGSAFKSKYSVSDFKHEAMNKYLEDPESETMGPATAVTEEEEKVPAFMDPEYIPGLATYSESAGAKEHATRGALRGTAVHRYMEGFDFKRLLNPGSLSLDELYDRELLRMLESGFIDDKAAELLPKASIITFLSSKLAMRMAYASAADLLYEEKAFVMGDKPSVFFSLYNSDIVESADDFCLVQGIIDVFFEEDGQFVLMDYKTDRVSDSSELIGLYKTQLMLYKMAIERNFKIPVREVLIYSFCLDETIVVGD